MKNKKVIKHEHIQQAQHKLRRMGFTIIELLVVVAIIGVLATIVVISVTGAQEKSRDAKRIGDLKQIDHAIDLFYTDKNHLPGALSNFTIYAINENNYAGGDSCYTSDGTAIDSNGDPVSYTSGTCTSMYGGQCANIGGGLKTYIPDICSDYGPKHTSTAYSDVYFYGFADSNKDTYHLGAQLEVEANRGPAFTYCSAINTCTTGDGGRGGGGYYLKK